MGKERFLETLFEISKNIVSDLIKNIKDKELTIYYQNNLISSVSNKKSCRFNTDS